MHALHNPQYVWWYWGESRCWPGMRLWSPQHWCRDARRRVGEHLLILTAQSTFLWVFLLTACVVSVSVSDSTLTSTLWRYSGEMLRNLRFPTWIWSSVTCACWRLKVTPTSSTQWSWIRHSGQNTTQVRRLLFTRATHSPPWPSGEQRGYTKLDTILYLRYRHEVLESCFGNGKDGSVFTSQNLHTRSKLRSYTSYIDKTNGWQILCDLILTFQVCFLLFKVWFVHLKYFNSTSLKNQFKYFMSHYGSSETSEMFDFPRWL